MAMNNKTRTILLVALLIIVTSFATSWATSYLNKKKLVYLLFKEYILDLLIKALQRI